MSTCVALKLKSRKKGEVGEALARWAGEAELAQTLPDGAGMSLSHFVYEDVDLLEEMLEYAPPESVESLQAQLDKALKQPQWHDPADGLASVRATLERLPDSPEGRAARDELKRFEKALLAAAERGDRFRLEVG